MTFNTRLTLMACIVALSLAVTLAPGSAQDKPGAMGKGDTAMDKDKMGKDAAKGDMKKDAMKKDEMKKDEMKKDEMKKDEMKKDEMKK